jgi:hypothetical protein
MWYKFSRPVAIIPRTFKQAGCFSLNLLDEMNGFFKYLILLIFKYRLTKNQNDNEDKNLEHVHLIIILCNEKQN